MPEHTIAENLSRLVTAKTDIANAITTMGGTVNSGDGFEEFPADILGIPSGAQVFSITSGGGYIRSCDGYGFFDGSVLVLAGLIVATKNYGLPLKFPQALSNYGFNPPEAVTGSFMCGTDFSEWDQYDLSGDSTGINITKSGSDNNNAFCGIWTLPT